MRLERKPAAAEARELDRVDRLVGELFSSRRQTLGRVLTRLIGSREQALQALSTLGLEPQRRAETLDLPVLLALARITG